VNIDIKKDGLKILTCTSSCSLGILDVSNYNYNTILRVNSSLLTDIDSGTDAADKL